jgi:hypothetical protein
VIADEEEILVLKPPENWDLFLNRTQKMTLIVHTSISYIEGGHLEFRELTVPQWNIEFLDNSCRSFSVSQLEISLRIYPSIISTPAAVKLRLYNTTHFISKSFESIWIIIRFLFISESILNDIVSLSFTCENTIHIKI